MQYAFNAVCNADQIIDPMQIGSSFKASPQDRAGTDASPKISASSTALASHQDRATLVSAETELAVIKAAADITDRVAADSQPSNDESAIQVRIPHTHHALLHYHL